MLAPGFITEVFSDPPAVTASAEDRTEHHRAGSGLAEQQILWNELRTKTKLREAELAGLHTMLVEVERESKPADLHLQLAAAKDEARSIANLLYSSSSEQTHFESEQLSHVLHRSQVSTTSRKAAILRIQRELRSLSSLRSTATDDVAGVEAHCQSSLKALRAVQRHKASLETEFAAQRSNRLGLVEAQHKAMSEVMKEAKEDKAKELAREGNVEKLREWLRRQREARKVMRLYIGLEEMGRKKIKRVLETVIRGCGGNTLDEALSNYSSTLARNSSLIHEAEYKLAQQASCVLHLSSMLAELQSLTSRLNSESACSLLFRLNKTDIYQAPALLRVRLAEITISDYEQKRQQQRLLLAQAADCIAGVYFQLHVFDPWHRSSARLPDFMPSKSPIPALLIVEKRLAFLYERVTPWLAAFLIPPKSDAHLTQIRTRRHLDSTKSKGSVLPRTSTCMDGLSGRGLMTALVEAAPRQHQAKAGKGISLLDKGGKFDRNIGEIRKEWEQLQRKSKKMNREKPVKRLSDLIFDLRAKERQASARINKTKSLELHIPDSKLSLVSPRSYTTVLTDTAVSSRKTETGRHSTTLTDRPKVLSRRLF